MKALRLAAAIGLLCAAGLAAAQFGRPAAGAPEQYQPLFTPEAIQKASPEQAARMRAAEERNREAWEARQRAARERAATAARGAEPTAPPAAPARRSRIFKWVDKDGSVHFGDAPTAAGAEEVQVGGAARESGRPLPSPGLTSGFKNQ